MFGLGELMAKVEEERLEAMYQRRTEAEERNRDDGDHIIPRHFAIKSKYNDKYLRYVSYDDDQLFDGLLQFTGERMISPYTKFEVEYSDIGKGYVQIRCCYNNRYLVRHRIDTSYIVAAASEPVNDLSDWRCTLFEPTYDRHHKAYHFRHVQLDANVYIYDFNPDISYILNASPSENYNDPKVSLFPIVDWDSIYILPRHVAFKGNNGKYLKFIGPKLQFSSSDIKDSSVAHEIFPTKDGNIHIRHDESGKFWIRDPDWIHAQSNDANSNDPNTLFWPVKVEDDVVALRNLGNHRFCKRLTIEGKWDCLNASAFSLTDEARMVVEEIVVSRTIDNVEYRLNDARIYGQKIVSMAKGDAINTTKETDIVTFKFSYENKTKTNWTSTLSTNIGVTTKFQAGVPIVGKGKIEVSAEIGSGYEWGETHKHKNTIELNYPVTVPPISRVKINAVVKQGMCQVPFSYRRTDLLKNGRRVVHHLHDGLFSGVNSYDYEFMSKVVPMESVEG
ncbi:uncharacterized protein LOC111022561 [Momordica charantia]|uniref:Uncharacterized protein LOC111022561 n=1 Tax=Momordica charantia TaxID=3673 RepID=A0A6J1DMW2_MOMCH|nr:uncharacterized protein LOC111022561 [Momordica charantia]